jgi:hypothetical protein
MLNRPQGASAVGKYRYDIIGIKTQAKPIETWRSPVEQKMDYMQSDASRPTGGAAAADYDDRLTGHFRSRHKFLLKAT